MSAEETKALILEAFDTLFNKRDYAKAAEFWTESYIQHSAHIPPGRDGLFDLVRAAPDTLRYENALILAEGNWALLHGRFTGNGRPRSWVAADVLRLEGGRLAEHWDVLQDEVTGAESKSGLPMFGDAFVDYPQASHAEPLSADEGRQIVAPLYDALNMPTHKDVAALLSQACHPDYKSYSTNTDWLSREQLIDVFRTLGAAVPDLSWEIKDVRTVADQVIVRGEAAGTPVAELFGVKPTGKSFRTMSIDVFTVRDGKLASAYHVENWAGALQQIQGDGARP